MAEWLVCPSHPLFLCPVIITSLIFLAAHSGLVTSLGLSCHADSHLLLRDQTKIIITIRPQTTIKLNCASLLTAFEMEGWEARGSLENRESKNASFPIVNKSCVNLVCYMVLTEAEKKAIGSICFLAGPLTFLENSVVLLVILCTASLRQRPSYLFIGSLALADVFASCFFTTSFLDFHLFRRSDGPTAYLFKLGGVTMAFTSSVGSLLLTALDRYLCIHQVSSYKVLVTRRRALLSLIILWTATTFISFLPLMGWRCPTGLTPPCSRLFPYINSAYLACWTSFVLVLLALILGAYALILWKAHRHEASMTSLQAAATSGQARMRMDIRLARTFGLILLILVGCWLPALSFMIADVSVVLSLTQLRAFAFCSTLCLVNSAVNPLLYALRCRELREALVQLTHRLCEMGKCKQPTEHLAPESHNGQDMSCSVLSENEVVSNRATQITSVSLAGKKN